MMSVRSGGDSLPELVGRELGPVVKQVMRVFSVVLPGACRRGVRNQPRRPCGRGMTPGVGEHHYRIGVIFIYYICATLLPIDKLIGRFTPVFGFALLFMALGLLGALLFGGHHTRRLCRGPRRGIRSPTRTPSSPMMCVSIACGAISRLPCHAVAHDGALFAKRNVARPVFTGRWLPVSWP